MSSGELRFGRLLKILAAGMVAFGAWGFVIGFALHWAERRWPSDEGRRSVAEAELRPEREQFRPLGDGAGAAAHRGTTYVPIHSTVYLGEREAQAGLAVTLSLRNTSPTHDLLVHRLDFFDAAGKLVVRLAEGTHAVPAMATAQFFIDRRDPSGGSGANYLVEWSVPEGGSEPVIEAVMVGRSATGAGLIIVSRGMPVTAARP